MPRHDVSPAAPVLRADTIELYAASAFAYTCGGNASTCFMEVRRHLRYVRSRLHTTAMPLTRQRRSALHCTPYQCTMAPSRTGVEVGLQHVLVVSVYGNVRVEATIRTPHAYGCNVSAGVLHAAVRAPDKVKVQLWHASKRVERQECRPSGGVY